MNTGATHVPSFGSRFDLRQRLGEGGFGVVYLAYDRRRRTRVALKELTRVEPRSLARFKNEFRSLVDVVHPNLVTLYELFFEEGRWYFTMEYVEGVSFLSYVWGGGAQVKGHGTGPGVEGSASSRDLGPRTENASTLLVEPARNLPTDDSGNVPRVRAAPQAGVYDEARLRSALAQLAAGVEALHRSGRLHRDLKPNNVLVSPEGRVVLLDFGLVLSLGAVEDDKHWEMAGTPAYMSPEQVRGGILAPPSDCYAIGVMLFEALTGRRPAEALASGKPVGGESPRDSSTPDALSPKTLVPEVPSDLDTVCAALLSEEPGKRPSASEVRARAFRPETDSVHGSRAPSSSLRHQEAEGNLFLGRDAELQVLEAAFRKSEAGEASLVWVKGPSGIGKSALLAQFLARVRSARPETLVLWGRCHQQESVPYKGVDAAVDALCRFLERITPEERGLYMPQDFLRLAQVFPVLVSLATGSSPQDSAEPAHTALVAEGPLEAWQVRRRAFAAFRELLGRIASVRPVLLGLDDLQWGDDDSGALLSELFRESGAPSLCFVGAFRGEEAGESPLLSRLMRENTGDLTLPSAVHIALGALPVEDSSRLAAQLMGARRDRALLVERIVRVSEGNPFLLGELTWCLQQSSAEEPLADEALVSHLVELRIASQTPAARRMLELVALSGVPVDTEVLHAATSRAEGETAALVALLAARLVRIQPMGKGEGVECYHDRIREAVLGRLESRIRRGHHQALARALEERPDADPEVLARHLREAGNRSGALGWLLLAARRAGQTLAFDRAARLYAEAQRLLPPGSSERVHLLRQQGEALDGAGRAAQAGHVFLETAALVPPAEALELRMKSAELLLKGGHYDEGLSVTEEVFRALGMAFPRGRIDAYVQAAWEVARLKVRGIGFVARPEAERSPAQLQISDACFAVAEPLQAVDPVIGFVLALRSTWHGLRSGDPFRASRALALHCVQTSLLDPLSEAPKEALAQAARLAHQSGDPLLLAYVSLASGTAAFFRGAFPQALTDGLEAERLFQQVGGGMQWESSTTALLVLSALQWLGRWGELAERFPVFLRNATDRGDLYGAAVISGAYGAYPGLAADDLEHIERDLVIFQVRHAPDLRFIPAGYEVISRAYLGLYRGEPEVVLAALRARWPELRRQGFTSVPLLVIELSYLRACANIMVLSRESSRLARVRLRQEIQRGLSALTRSGLPVGRALAGLLQASFHLAEQRTAAGLAGLARAVPAMDALGLTLHVATADYRRGDGMGGVEGRGLARKAADAMCTLGIRNPGRLTAALVPG